jgi:rare lipoprotein A
MIVSLCPAQTQTGNASYNASKTGFTISHSSLSFNTHVRVTNLSNNRSVDATVNGRIPIGADRIADISQEAGDALGMSRTGMTLVEIAELPAGGVQAAAPPPSPPPAPPPVAVLPPAPAQQPAASPPVTQILPIQTVTDVEYVQVPGSTQSNCCSPLLWVILLLLVLVVLLLTLILILVLRRLLLWPWRYRVWYRRHLLYARKYRR